MYILCCSVVVSTATHMVTSRPLHHQSSVYKLAVMPLHRTNFQYLVRMTGLRCGQLVFVQCVLQGALYNLHVQRASEWAALDHASGNVTYPAWADTYFSMHTGAVSVPGHMEASGVQARSALATSGGKGQCGYFSGLGADAGDQVDPFAMLMAQQHNLANSLAVRNKFTGNATGRNLLQQWNPPELCNLGVTSIAIPLGSACDLTISTKYFKARVMC